MRARLSALAALCLLAASCAVCDRATGADGRYQATSDCSGALMQGTLTIGAFVQPPSCGATDAGTHAAQYGDDAGEPADAGSAPVVCQPIPTDSLCADTEAQGAPLLGLPSQVKVNGPGDFQLTGEVGGRTLTCSPQSFGDELILLCRDSDRIVCAAALTAQ